MREHGTEACYKAGCRCAPCTKATSKADAMRKLDRMAGRPRSVPAGPVRKHIEELFARGLTSWQIARESGVAPTTVVRITQRSGTVHRDTAEKILSLPLDVRVSLGDVPAVGASRRIQALYALGHRVAVISGAAGISRDAVALLAMGRWVTLKVQADDGVRRAYAQLSMSPGPSSRTRRIAEQNGWAPPLAWDDDTLDDPAAEPLLDAVLDTESYDEVAVRRYADGAHIDLNPTERLAAVALCVARGMTFADVDRVHGHGSSFTSVFVGRMRRAYERDGRPFPEALAQYIGLASAPKANLTRAA